MYALVAIALPIVLPVFSWGKPSGPYSIGTATYHWTDSSREALNGSKPGARRELTVQLWYPSIPVTHAKTAPYVDHPAGFIQSMQSSFGLPKWLFNNLTLIQTNAASEAKVSGQQQKYPLLLFSHGLGLSGSFYTEQMEYLASQGYIIASINHTDYSLFAVSSDGSISNYNEAEDGTSFNQNEDTIMDQIWLKDAKFVLDQLEGIAVNDPKGLFNGKIDFTRVGMLGHSFGGATAVQMLLTDNRVKAALNMDGTFAGKHIAANGFDKPFMFITTPEPSFKEITDDKLKEIGLTREEFILLELDWKRRHEHAADHGNYKLTLKAADHLSFSDMYYLSPLADLVLGFRTQKVHQIVNEMTLHFFDVNLKGHSSESLTELIGDHEDYTLFRGE